MVYFQLGQAYQTHQDFSTAQKNFQQAISLEPRFFPAYYNLGLIAQEQTNYNQAIGYFQQALEQDPSNSAIRRSLSTSYIALGDNQINSNQPTQALGSYYQATQSDPTDQMAQTKFENLCKLFPKACGALH